MRTLYTLGHSTRSLDELVAILHAHEIDCLVDIRTIPRSRTNPQFNADTLPKVLAEAGIDYRLLRGLGGRRGKSKEIADAVNAGWRVRAFHNYADYAMTATFRTALEELLALAAETTCATMCSEAVWWRCHRRIVTDHALARGVPVVHLFSVDHSEAATLTPFARIAPDLQLTYPSES